MRPCYAVLAAAFAVGLWMAATAVAQEIHWQEAWRVKDDVGVLTESWHDIILARISLYQEHTGRKFAVWIKAKLPEAQVEALISQKFAAWNLADPNSQRGGLLLAVDTTKRTAYVALAPDMLQRISPALSQQIVSQRIEPFLAQADFGRAIDSGLLALMRATSGPGLWDSRQDDVPSRFLISSTVLTAAGACIGVLLLAGLWWRRQTKRPPAPRPFPNG